MKLNPEHVGAQLLLRSWPFPRGSGRLADRFFSKIKFRDDVQTVTTTDGFSIKVITNDLIGRHIYLTGEFDRSTFEVLHAFSKSGDTLLDVGANIGYMSACFLSVVNDSKVIAMDPQPLVRDLLTENLRRFADRQRVLHVALSDSDGTAGMAINNKNRGASKLVESTESALQVNKLSVDTLLKTIGTAISLIKIDVEGHEENVIEAIRPHLITTLQPRAILFEDHGAKAAPDAAIGKSFAETGYRVFGVKKRLTRLELVPIMSQADCAMNDYVAVRTQLDIPLLAQHTYGLPALL